MRRIWKIEKAFQSCMNGPCCSCSLAFRFIWPPRKDLCVYAPIEIIKQFKFIARKRAARYCLLSTGSKFDATNPSYSGLVLYSISGIGAVVVGIVKEYKLASPSNSHLSNKNE